MSLIAILAAFLLLHLIAYFCDGYRARLVRGRSARDKFRMQQLRNAAKAAFSPSNFAASAKLERQANACEKRLKEDGASPRLKMAAKLMKGIQACLCIALLWAEQPPRLEDVPGILVTPMENRLGMPANPLATPAPPPAGVAAVRILGWLFLCDRFAAASVEALDALIAF